MSRKPVYSYKQTYYAPTYHLEDRYKERMSKAVMNKSAKKRIMKATTAELAKRANYMLLFSIHGRDTYDPTMEVRYYFNWDIVINNRDRTIVTMYINDKRKVPPVRLFGDQRLRKMIYNLWFMKNNQMKKQLLNV